MKGAAATTRHRTGEVEGELTYNFILLSALFVYSGSENCRRLSLSLKPKKSTQTGRGAEALQRAALSSGYSCQLISIVGKGALAAPSLYNTLREQKFTVHSEANGRSERVFRDFLSPHSPCPSLSQQGLDRAAKRAEWRGKRAALG